MRLRARIKKFSFRVDYTLKDWTRSDFFKDYADFFPETPLRKRCLDYTEFSRKFLPEGNAQCD
jgi:hypothetical protein